SIGKYKHYIDFDFSLNLSKHTLKIKLDKYQ
ncbi:MAG: hypothetical protein ACI9LF_001554, partial [Flavobacteriales bacterium]